jgi:hypothetical protein
MRNLTWTETTDHQGNTMWSCEIGKYRLVVTESPNNPGRPFHGSMHAEYGYGPVFILSGKYKTAKTAKTGLTRRLDSYTK